MPIHFCNSSWETFHLKNEAMPLSSQTFLPSNSHKMWLTYVNSGLQARHSPGTVAYPCFAWSFPKVYSNTVRAYTLPFPPLLCFCFLTSIPPLVCEREKERKERNSTGEHEGVCLHSWTGVNNRLRGLVHLCYPGHKKPQSGVFFWCFFLLPFPSLFPPSPHGWHRLSSLFNPLCLRLPAIIVLSLPAE